MSYSDYDDGENVYGYYEDNGNYLNDDLSIYAQCCRNCRFFHIDHDGSYGLCMNPDLDEFDNPSEKGDDCCDLWEMRGEC